MSRSTLFPSLGQAVLLVIATLVLQWGLAFGVGVVGAAVSTESTMRLAGNPWFLGMLNIVAIGAALIFGLRITGERTARFLSVRRFDLSLLPPILFTSVSLAVVVDQSAKVFFELMRFFPQWPVRDLGEELMATHPIGGFLLVVAVAPFTEEYLFRGMILRGLLTRHRVWVAVLISALLFGVMHGNVLQFHLGLATGCLFGWWFARTGSIGPGLVGHAAFNGVAWLSTVFPLHFAPLGPSTGPDIVHQPAWFTLTAVVFAGLGVWWFKGRADALEEFGIPGGWEESIPAEPTRDTPPLLEPPVPEPPLLEPPVPGAALSDLPLQMELDLPSLDSPSPPVLAAEPPLLEPPLLEPPEVPPLGRDE